MLRALLEETLLFILPFCVFAGYLVVKRRNPFDVAHWSRHLFILAAIGLALSVALFAFTAWNAPRYSGAYEPPHMENGKLVPGRFR